MICRCASLDFTSASVFFCLLSVISLGCDSGAGGATISGTVKSNGNLIPTGRVVFSNDTTSCAGEISSGSYELKSKGKSKVPLGEYTVTVFPPKMTVFNPETGEDERIKGDVDLSLFPQKYQSTGSSDIKFSPKAGDNDFDIMMEN